MTSAAPAYSTDIPLLHIDGQPHWHASAFISGNLAGLIALRDALTLAIDTGAAKTKPFAADGEGFSVAVLRLSEGQMDEVPLPYTDTSICPRSDRPEWLVRLAHETLNL